MSPWKVLVPRISIERMEGLGPFENWGQAESERLRRNQYVPASVVEVPR